MDQSPFPETTISLLPNRRRTDVFQPFEQTRLGGVELVPCHLDLWRRERIATNREDLDCDRLNGTRPENLRLQSQLAVLRRSNNV